MRPEEWVQAILVGPDGSHLGVIESAAKASTLALAKNPSDPSWRAWLAGQFTKTVRRVKPTVLAQVEALGATLVTESSGAVAAALPPSLYADLPKAAARAQVQGLQRDLPEPSWQPSSGLWVVLNADLGMSTGKAAAQAAHALMAAAVEFSGLDPAALRAAAQQARFAWVASRTFETLAQRAEVVIADAGHTEVAAGTRTALALVV